MAVPIATGISMCGGGQVIATGLNVFINGAPTALVGDSITIHGEGFHAVSKILTGTPNVFVNGRPIATLLSATTCGDPILTNQYTVMG